MDKLTAMRTFVAAAQSGSFTAAARLLGVPRTRVSQRIQDLEAALSIRLFHRSTRVISLTEEGAGYLDRCTAILEEIDSVEQTLGTLGGTPAGQLRVTCLSLVARAFILPRLHEFLEAYPGISVSLSVSDQIANMNKMGFDCAIRGGRSDDSTLISRHICDTSFRLFAAPNHLARIGPLETPTDLAEAALIKTLGQTDGLVRHWHLDGPGGVFHETSPPRLVTDDDQATLDAALGEIGIALCPDFAAAPYLKTDRLVPVLPNWSAPARGLFFIYPSKKYVPAKLKCFIDWTVSITRGPIEEAGSL